MLVSGAVTLYFVPKMQRRTFSFVLTPEGLHHDTLHGSVLIGWDTIETMGTFRRFCQPFVGCVVTPLDGVACQDNNPCTTDDVCRSGVCTGDARNCFDDDPCTSQWDRDGDGLDDHEDACVSRGAPSRCSAEQLERERAERARHNFETVTRADS